MAKKDKSEIETQDMKTTSNPKITDLEWTDYVLGLLSDDEKIMGNPTTDGLRRVFELAMEARIISSTSQIVQSPSPENEKRATVCHSLTFRLNPGIADPEGLNLLTVDGSADVYWGNCDKIFRNHPVAVAETRAEGRALRRALRLKKVVAAEELAESVEDNVDGLTVTKISSNQINFIDVIAKRLNINVTKLFDELDITYDSIYNIKHEHAVSSVQKLNHYQQNMSNIPEQLIGYQDTWK
jgi:hypothetical protein